MTLNFIRGFLMAMADSVPGVSGGTIAFILGFYDKFVMSLENLMKGNSNEKKDAFKFLFKIGIGWIFGFLLSVLFITALFEHHIYDISSLFLGFIIFSIPIIIKEEKETLSRDYKNIYLTFIGIFIVILITIIGRNIGDSSYSLMLEDLTLIFIIYLLLVGIIAISSMVLPGISGSTILLIFGLYGPVLIGVNEVIHLNFSYLPGLIFLSFGFLIGLFVTVKIVNYCLNNYRNKTMYLIIGLMIGSLVAVINGPSTISSDFSPLSISTFNIIFFIIGGMVILFLEKIRIILEEKSLNN